MATPKPAPELTPKIYGSAKGFRKLVCISKPLTDKAIPTKIAVKALGILKFNKIKLVEVCSKGEYKNSKKLDN